MHSGEPKEMIYVYLVSEAYGVLIIPDELIKQTKTPTGEYKLTHQTPELICKYTLSAYHLPTVFVLSCRLFSKETLLRVYNKICFTFDDNRILRRILNQVEPR